VSEKDDEHGAVTLVERILERAVADGASDVHIEPSTREVRVRFRIDGLLVQRPSIPSGFRQSVVSRLKIMAKLDIAEKRLPQDGAFRTTAGAREVDVRMATFPTEYGEKVVLRILSRAAGSINLDGLGMGQRITTQLKATAQRAHGMILVTGPTGSGKTTTLYGLINEIDARARNVMTLEDPIEYRFADVIQGQAHGRIGFTFAKGLRSILRQDPDVVMVGEMRDAETAAIAFKAALTGHLVLSSLHTNSAIETFVRLFDMGIERYVVASALSAMMGQRLVRKLCSECCRPTQADSAARIMMGVGPGTSVVVNEAVGCKSCLGTGYRGRVGVFELVEVDDELADLVKDEDTTRATLRQFMGQRGAHGLRASGFELVRRGITSVAEVVRVT